MADTLTKAERSRNMSAIKGRDTKPEIAVRQFLHSQGIGFRLHGKDLPGRPDIVMKGRRTVIFVNGCYWHRHPGCRFAYTPKSNQAFWLEKFKGNVERDQRNYKALKEAGWQVIIIWECEIKAGGYQPALLEQIPELS